MVCRAATARRRTPRRAATATVYCRRGGAERRTQHASSRRKPCVHAAPNAAHSALPAAANRVRMPRRRRCRDSGHGANR